MNTVIIIRIIIRIVLVFIIFIVPFILTSILSAGKHTTYEFVDEKNKRMVAPAAPFPYISELFSDFFIQLKKNWYSFCIQNNCYSKENSLPLNIGVKLEGMNDFITIHYGETKCFPIFKKDVFYDVAVGGLGELVIPNKEWAEKHFKLKDGSYGMEFQMKDVMNFKVYTKLSLNAMVVIYVLFVLSFFGAVEFLISLYRFIALLKL
jgi:hypothetical protein